MSLELTPLVGSLSALLAKKCWDVGAYLSQELNSQIRQTLFHSSKQYVERYANRHATLKVLDMSEPLSLEALYSSTKLWSEPRLKGLISLEQLELFYRSLSNQSLSLARSTKYDGLSVVQSQQYLVVLGSPGAGKTTFLRWSGWNALKSVSSDQQEQHIPVFIELKRLPTNNLDLKKTIVTEFETCGFPSAEKFVSAALQKGRLLILLDGLDEVPQSHRNDLVNVIQDFVDCYHKNRFILSCRTPAYLYHLTPFTDFEVADFDDSQIERFIQHWFYSELDQYSDTAGKLWKSLEAKENRLTKDLARTPLLLAFICLVYDRDTSLPDNLGLLYGKALDILLRRWSAEKRIERDPIYQGFSPELEKLLLSEIAYQGFIKEQLFFPEQQVLQEIQSFLAETLDASPFLDSQKILGAIEEQHGILLKQAEGIFSFSHLTLQEYLTARHIALDEELMKEHVFSHLGDSRWNEIFLLTAGLIPCGDKLLIHIEEAARQYLNTPRLLNLVTWVNQITGNSLSERILAVMIALTLTQNHSYGRVLVLLRALVFSHDSELAKGLDAIQAGAFSLASNPNLSLCDLAYHLAQQLDALEAFNQVNLTALSADIAVLRSNSSNKNMSEGETRLLWSLWLETFRLNRELVSLSLSEIENLERYLDANLLILRCKKSAVRVLRTTWDSLEQRMLSCSQLVA
jgi:hypothetical protein